MNALCVSVKREYFEFNFKKKYNKNVLFFNNDDIYLKPLVKVTIYELLNWEESNMFANVMNRVY